MEVKEIKNTSYIESPDWNGDGFDHPVANRWWQELPPALREIAIDEMGKGNKIEQILRNNDRNIVLLSFESGPYTAEPDDENIEIHTKHSYGNYCYDGTKCTYEEKMSGCFLSFEDPDYQEDDF
jgi:hypothetical protein